jgi:hypothetical protein
MIEQRLGKDWAKTLQGIILKKDNNRRVVWDGSTKRMPTDIVLNEITSVEDEAEIVFGDTKMHFYGDVYNLRISYPYDSVLDGSTRI